MQDPRWPFQKIINSTTKTEKEIVNIPDLRIDLGQATKDKFNEVSKRVGSSVYIEEDDWHNRHV